MRPNCPSALRCPGAGARGRCHGTESFGFRNPGPHALGCPGRGPTLTREFSHFDALDARDKAVRTFESSPEFPQRNHVSTHLPEATDRDSPGDPRMDRLPRVGHRQRRTRPSPLPAAAGVGVGTLAPRRTEGAALHRLRQHDCSGRAGAVPGRPRPREENPPHQPLECDGHGPARQRALRRLGRPLSSYASSASLYEVGFNHFFRGPEADGVGDLIFYQGHVAPGMYARAFLEGRLTEGQLDHFREKQRAGPASAPIRILGSCPSFGSSPPSAWGLARLRPSIRHALRATSRTAASKTRAARTSGRSWAMASATSRRASVSSASRPARSSTT